MTLPASDRFEQITEAVLEILTERGREWISQFDLGVKVFYRCRLPYCGPSSRARRIKEAIHSLRVERRILIGSGPRGYALDSSRDGLKRILAQIRSEAEVLRAYDPALADALNGWLRLAEAA